MTEFNIEERRYDPLVAAEKDLERAKSTDLWEGAVRYLRENMPNTLLEQTRDLYEDSPDNWIAPYHFSTGMWIRNELRNNGYGEKEFDIGNMDNIYVELLEEAAGLHE